MSTDVSRYHNNVTTVWAVKSLVSDSQHFSGATEQAMGAYRYNSPTMTRTAAVEATPIALNGAANYVGAMYAGAGASFGVLARSP